MVAKVNGKKIPENLFVQARYTNSRRVHCFGEGDRSLCGIAHIEECDNLSMIKTTKRLGLYVWPKEDLNFCGRCRLSLNAKGVI